MKKLKCKFCIDEFDRDIGLRFHVAEAHHRTYATKIMPYLENTEQKLYQLIIVAQDCMYGRREPTYKRIDESVDRF